LKSSHQLLKYNWINFSSKQRSFYFTKLSRGPDSTTQRAGFGPRAVCLTPLLWKYGQQKFLTITRVSLLSLRSLLPSTRKRSMTRNCWNRTW